MLASVYASACSQGRRDVMATPADSENACTACDDENECHEPSLENGLNRQASFVLSGRWRPTTGFNTLTMPLDTA